MHVNIEQCMHGPAWLGWTNADVVTAWANWCKVAQVWQVQDRGGKGHAHYSLNGMTLLQSLHMGMALVVSFVVSLG